ARELRFDLEGLEDLPPGHRHVFRAGKGASLTEAILFRKRRSIEVPARPAAQPPAPGDAADPGAAPSAPGSAAGALDFFKMGLEHILLGYDHLVFLLGLVLVGGRWRAILLVVTAFTVAHSITLGLAALGLWAPSPRVVEPAIALSIAYVGVENHFVKDAERRWRITFPFGLVHGFGFAGALAEVSLPRGDIPGALLAFNLGVEAGQIAVLALVLPVMAIARRRGLLEQRGVRLASALIALAGLSWFVARVLGG
ncbi:MAG: HupE/UreJ family protein, partial [Polyangiaceae bacterium]|nr:HupE/UreJ family protein [Polyangiaceae bacterium]